MPEQDIEYNIKLKQDQAALQQTAAGLAKIDKRFADLQDAVKDTAKEAKRAGKVLPDVFDSKEIRNAEKALRQTERAMKDYGDSARVAAQQVEAFGDLDSQLNTLRGALDTFGVGGGLGAGLLGTAEIAASVEAVGRLGPAIGDVAQKTTGAVPALGALAGGVSKALPGLSSAGASLAALGGVGLVAGAAIGVVALAFKGLSDDAKETAKQVRAEIEARKEYYQLLAEGALTTENINTQIQENNRQLEANRLELEETNREIARQEKKKAGGGIFASAQGELRDALVGDPFGLDELKKRRDELEASTAQLAETNERLNEATQDGTTVAQDRAAAEERLIQARIQFAQSQASIELQLLAAREQTSESLLKQIETARAQIAIYQEQLETTRAAGGDVSALSLRIREMSDTANRLEAEILPTVEAQEKQARINERLKETADAVKDKFKELADQFQQQQADLADATQAYNDDVESIQQASYEKLAALQEKYNDSLVKAAEKLVDDQQKITEKLNETIANLGQDAAKAQADAQQNLQQSLSDAALDSRRSAEQAARELRQSRIDEIVDSQRAERDAARDHLLKLQKIRDDAQAEEQDAAANRDFRRLFQIRQQTSRELETANEEYNQERADRQQQLQDRLSDLAVAYQREKEERQIDYQQRINDLQAQNIREQQERQADYQQRLIDAKEQAQKERAEVQQAYQTQLVELRDKHTQEQQELQRQNQAALELRRQQANEELELISKSASERLAIEKATQEKLIAQARSMLSQVQSAASLARPTGGAIPPGGIPQFASSTGGASLAGLGGSIYNTTNNQNASITANNNIYNQNPNITGQQIAGVVTDILGGIFN